MPSDAAYFRAANPEPPRCVGLQLRPYSLGHHIILSSYGCSFLDSTPEFKDLITGVLICSMTTREWSDWKRSWKLVVFLKAWGWLVGNFDVRAQSEVFAKYITDGSVVPEVAIPTKGRELTSEWESRLKLFLVRELRLTVEQALEYPLALAWSEYCAHHEKAGEITLLTESDKQSLKFVGSKRMLELVEEMRAQAKAERN